MPFPHVTFPSSAVRISYTDSASPLSEMSLFANLRCDISGRSARHIVRGLAERVNELHRGAAIPRRIVLRRAHFLLSESWMVIAGGTVNALGATGTVSYTNQRGQWKRDG
jgi:hypothetical protein